MMLFLIERDTVRRALAGIKSSNQVVHDSYISRDFLPVNLHWPFRTVIPSSDDSGCFPGPAGHFLSKARFASKATSPNERRVYLALSLSTPNLSQYFRVDEEPGLESNSKRY